jgi:hypothetical protein
MSDTVGGTCSTYFFGQYWPPDAVRWMSSLTVDMTSPQGNQSHGAAYGRGAYQTFDTRNPATTSGFSTTPMWEEGTYRFDFLGFSEATGCQFPVASPMVTRTINSVKCEPKFKLDGNNHIKRLKPGTVHLYVPTDMADILPAATSAADAWNGVLSGIGLTFDVVTESCGDGDNCIPVSVDATLGTLCGNSGDVFTNSSGEILGGMSLTLNSNWQSYSADGMRRTLVHEIGHYLGLGNYNASACSVSDAVMQDTFNCVFTGAVYQPTIDDYLPIQKTNYGPLGSRRVCGF